MSELLLRISHLMFDQKDGGLADLRADIANALHWDLANTA